MKATLLCGGLALCLAAGSAQASIYNDATGDLFNNGFGHLDITSAEVNDDGTNINFKITLNGDPVATDWGKYMVMIDTVAGGDDVGNGWARPISWGQGGGAGADYWLGSWADTGNGAENWKYTGSWALQDASYSNGLVNLSKNSTSVTITLPLASLGLGAGQTFYFDIFTSGGGGGDGAVDSLGNPNQQVADWGNPSNAHPQSYTTTPEPGSLILLGLGSLAFIRRRR